MTTATIRVAVVDDQELLRSALAMMIESQPDLELAGTAADGVAAIRLADEAAPDVILMDIRMPDLDGITATARIVARQPATKIIALTTFDLDEYALDAIRAGASGFLLKDARGEEIVEAIRVVNSGQSVIAPTTTRRLVAQLAPAGEVRADELLQKLTAREAEVWRRLADGASNAEIAATLVVSETTVKTHVAHLLAKLRVRDRVQAVVLAYESGLIRPGRDA